MIIRLLRGLKVRVSERSRVQRPTMPLLLCLPVDWDRHRTFCRCGKA